LTVFAPPAENAEMAKQGGIVRKEGVFAGQGGAELFYQAWSPEAKPPLSTFVVTHGISEHSDAYDRFASALVIRGHDVVAWDLRGHGRSSGKRGHVGEFKNYSNDLAIFLDFLKSNGRLAGPFFLFGHSMGGLVTLRCALDHGTAGATAICLSAPLLGVSLAVPPLKDLAARALNRFWPSCTLHNEIAYDDLTHDRGIIASYEVDPLRHDKISPPLYLGLLDTIAYVESRASEIRGPFLLQVAGRERIVSRPAMEAFFEKIGSRPDEKKILVYPESLHEIFNDLDRKNALDDLDAFARETLSSNGSRAGGGAGRQGRNA
jgi:alpha-beta hydrolase superfamily lysophospholipase